MGRKPVCSTACPGHNMVLADFPVPLLTTLPGAVNCRAATLCIYLGASLGLEYFSDIKAELFGCKARAASSLMDSPAVPVTESLLRTLLDWVACLLIVAWLEQGLGTIASCLTRKKSGSVSIWSEVVMPIEASWVRIVTHFLPGSCHVTARQRAAGERMCAHTCIVVPARGRSANLGRKGAKGAWCPPLVTTAEVQQHGMVLVPGQVAHESDSYSTFSCK